MGGERGADGRDGEDGGEWMDGEVGGGGVGCGLNRTLQNTANRACF